MKLIAIPLAAALLATAAHADTSDRYRDMRLDTSRTGAADADNAADKNRRGASPRRADPRPAPGQADRTDTSDRAITAGPSYAYASPFGVGPDNDSR
ncbi:hypothetical protein [Sulfitobacter sabulilitoris]|uniref:Hydroxyquinol 1,2-dioxygenase n=1 Tax=Sulfitobacter sabulilitoris TaxID=2562655 RepID=A0A5S3PLQ2_9RHOB|nr:hypothetical protein [Sulfitobacter sabulilitoris]TMM55313.1 hypothetical protein FDT80_07105 [Sulfitobacter sabulilitoris]